MNVHFIDVGCGNMVLICLPEHTIFMYDCNITRDNKNNVISYLNRVIGHDTPIDVFINSHRDADHMRGIKILHKEHSIKEIWDTGVPGTTTDSKEYMDYMDMLRKIPNRNIKARKYWTYGKAKLRCMNSQWEDYSEPNEQSVVLKIEYKVRGSVILAGDTNFRPWREKILKFYESNDLKSNLLFGAHHGSIGFFDDPSNTKKYFTAHIRAIKPEMTIISVGPNSNSLPDKKAVKLYEKYSSGSKQGNKVYTTQNEGTMKLILKDNGGWTLKKNQ